MDSEPMLGKNNFRAEEIRLHYGSKELADAVNKSRLFAIMMMKKHGYSGFLDAEDLAQSAIKKLLSGERTWAPEKYTLTQHLFLTVRSDFSHQLEIENRNVPGDFSDLEEFIDYLRNTSLNDPSYKYTMEETLRTVNEHVESNGDEFVKLLLLAYTKYGYERHQNAEIAEYYNLPISVIANAKKRLDRLIIVMRKDFRELVERGQ